MSAIASCMERITIDEAEVSSDITPSSASRCLSKSNISFVSITLDSPASPLGADRAHARNVTKGLSGAGAC